MSKWHPKRGSCIYVIPDIHGNANELELILNRILPLRNNKNAVDKLIFLGDYIDRGPDSPRVLDLIIKAKKKHPEQVVCLMGNHEWMMLVSSGMIQYSQDPKLPSVFSIWVNNGGLFTIKQYAERKNVDLSKSDVIDQIRGVSFLDQKHLDFLKNETVVWHEEDGYIFVHAGMDPFVPPQYQSEDVLLWDTSFFAANRNLRNKGITAPWDKTIVCGHNYKGPFISDKYMMLDSSYNKKLIVAEVSSTKAYEAIFGNKKLLTCDLYKRTPDRVGKVKRIE